jgi:hypothetical protein
VRFIEDRSRRLQTNSWRLGIALNGRGIYEMHANAKESGHTRLSYIFRKKAE